MTVAARVPDWLHTVMASILSMIIKRTVFTRILLIFAHFCAISANIAARGLLISYTLGFSPTNACFSGTSHTRRQRRRFSARDCGISLRTVRHLFDGFLFRQCEIIRIDNDIPV